MSESAWIGAVLTAARPRAVAALLRYFRNLDMADEAFQEASLRALRTWPKNGPPRDAAAWLIMVGRNAGIDAVGDDLDMRSSTACPTFRVAQMMIAGK